jgi:hypothetical protein
VVARFLGYVDRGARCTLHAARLFIAGTSAEGQGHRVVAGVMTSRLRTDELAAIAEPVTRDDRSDTVRVGDRGIRRLEGQLDRCSAGVPARCSAVLRMLVEIADLALRQ